MRVIGTAGHVDHGKSTLIQALTGVHPDRLKEEREREMTIDLGFAWFNLPPIESNERTDPIEGEEVGIIDVPGHRDFIENMLAGVGGIDAALFVVAADEGVMPQTREHLAILDILEIKGGVVVLNKIDLVEDVEWLDLVESDLREALQGTVLEDAQIVRVSARNGVGLGELKEALRATLANAIPRPDLKRPRMPIDRVFSMAGFGTVVTGTLLDGSLQVGEEVEIYPQGLRGRVRGLQTHKRKEQIAVPGSRTAINISGVAKDQVKRGDVVAYPGGYKPSRRMDVSFRLLPDVSQPLKHNTEVKLFIGAAEVVARLRLLGVEQLSPGQDGWLQLELQQPVVAVRGDRYILRRPSPGETLGGGQVIDPQPRGRYKRFSPATLSRLEELSQGTPRDVLNQALLSTGPTELKEVITRSTLDRQVALQAAEECLSSGLWINLDQDPSAPPNPNDLVVAKALWDQIASRATHETSMYHMSQPLRAGMPREELNSRLRDVTRGSARLFNAALRRLIAEGALKEAGTLVMLPDHSIQFSPGQEKKVTGLLKRFEESPFSPPTLKECQSDVGEEVVNALVETGRLVAVPPDVLFRAEDYEHLVHEIRRLLTEGDTLTVAQVRDHFQTSRRYALALLEHLDAIGITLRQGDLRKLKR